MAPGDGPQRLADVIEELSREDDRFHMEGGSWTNDASGLRSYDDILIPMQRASALFHERVLRRGIPTSDPRYRNALFTCSPAKTSCYRYWDQRAWTGLRGRAGAPNHRDHHPRPVSTMAPTAEILPALVTNLRHAARNPEHVLAEQPLKVSEILCARWSALTVAIGARADRMRPPVGELQLLWQRRGCTAATSTSTPPLSTFEQAPGQLA